MRYCLNLRCPNPYNRDTDRFCIRCGSKLLLGDRFSAIKSISESNGRTFLGVDLADPSHPQCVIKQVSLRHHQGENTEQARRTFREEALKLQFLGQHSQIPQLLAYFEAKDSPGGMPMLVQEWIEGKSLAEEKCGEAEIRQLLHHLLPVLQFVHENNLMHRDINPYNLIRPNSPTPDKPIVLVDFSTAKVTNKTAFGKTGTLIGSAAYASPEQLLGKATPQSDLYSLGVVCIHLLTQMHPFNLFSHLDAKWVWQDYLSTPISERLAAILNKMLAEGLRDRYSSAAEVYADLHPGATLDPILEPPSAAPKRSALTPQWQCFRTLEGHRSSVHAIAFHPNQNILASGSADRTIKLWNLDREESPTTLSGHESIIEDIAFSPDGEQLFSSSWDYSIRVWQNNKEIQQFREHSGWIQALAISLDGQFLASGSADKTIKIWDLENLRVEITLSGHEAAIHSLAIAPDGQFLASGSADKTIKIWDLKTGEERATLLGHSDTINALIFSPSGQILFSASADKTIQLWHLQSGTPHVTFKGHSDAVHALAINREGNLLVSGSGDNTLKLWSPGNGNLITTLTEHTSGILAVAISSDNRTIASASQDKTLKLWRFK
ncbi:protein kinase domain-containing protein [Lusitaniella coriacea]|uniref:protein kinase domain-containing protein n=1 Tax=Lusitaniella coriacea TaxID=1983105 RepID=UPI003CF0AE1A